MTKKLFTTTKPAFGFVRALIIWSTFVERAEEESTYTGIHTVPSCSSISKFSDEKEKQKDRIKNTQKV